MAITAPTPITALSGVTPPSTESPVNFDARGDATLGSLPALITQENALATVNYANAVDAYNSALAAQASEASALGAATAAQTSAGAAVWVSGASYTLGQAAYSTVNMRVYRRTVAGAGTTDPSADPSNWAGINSDLLPVVVVGTAQAASANCWYLLTNVAATTVTLPAAPANGDTVWVTVANSLFANVIARNGKTIMGLSEDMTIDKPYATARLRYGNNSWRIL